MTVSGPAAARKFDPENGVTDLLKKGRTSVKGMWSEKKGSTYDAVVILDDTGGKYVNFKLEFPKRKDGVHGKSKAEVNFMEHLKPLLPAGGDASELEAAAQALAGLSRRTVTSWPLSRSLLPVDHPGAVPGVSRQYRVFCPGAQHPQGGGCGWRYLAQHLDVLLPPELLDAIDPVPFGNHAMQEEQGCFTSRGYLTLSGDEWEHERPRERQTEKKPSIKERLEQSRKECANQSKAQPHREKPAPER